MTITWTALTNPPPAGNITLVDDTEVDGSEGVVSHSGGYIRLASKILTILEDAELDQAGGNLSVQTGGGSLKMEAGSKVTFSGSDLTYGLFFASNRASGFLVQGTSAKHCTIGGKDPTHRMGLLYLDYLQTCVVYYCDFKYACSGIGYSYTFSSSNGYYFNHCTFDSDDYSVLSISTVGIMVFDSCVIGSGVSTYTFHTIGIGTVYLFDCSIDQIGTSVTHRYGFSEVTVIHNDITWISATPSKFLSSTNLSSYSTGVFEILCSKFTVAEGNSLSDCDIVSVHQNYPDLLDLVNIDTEVSFNFAFILTQIKNLLDQSVQTDSGSAYFYVPYKFSYFDHVAKTTTWYDLSVSGGSYIHNGYFKLRISKEGYQTQSTILYGSSDQTWSPTLVEQTGLDDIITAITSADKSVRQWPR